MKPDINQIINLAQRQNKSVNCNKPKIELSKTLDPTILLQDVKSLPHT